ncbi:MAG TPA: polysaccharide deacetylase family protein [Candidatus Saccharimonadales bacterium]|nr:polysaccharide deacetylase family protein [Candidatus Saccharimonadales bacterium]
MNLSKVKSGLLAFLTVSALTFSVVLPLHAAAINMIPNPSAETATADGAMPLHWQKNAWGTNAATFAYKTDGYESARSLLVTMNNYQDGDAKWYVDPIDAAPNTKYTFSSHYKSNVNTHIVAVSLDANNQPYYWDVALVVPASPTTWANATYSVTTPDNTKKLSILHVIESNGWLQTDAVSLSLPEIVTPPTPPTQPNGQLVPNASLETASATNASLPAYWSTSQWGENTPKYEYLKSGAYQGSRSVKLTVSNYKSGDAKWKFAAQPLTPGKDYAFNTWYRSNTTPHMVAEFQKADGSYSYFGMPDPLTSGTNWYQYKGVFTVPAEAVNVSVFVFLTSNGWVQTDDYSLAPYQYPAYTRGMVTLTFDDAFERNVDTVLPVLSQYGFKTTQCYATQYIQGLNDQIANVKKFSKAGHETCAHSITHPELTKVTTTQLRRELSNSQSFLKSITGEQVKTFATPYGDYNATVNNEIKKYYSAHRTTDEGYNAKDNLDQYRLRVQNMTPSTTLAQFQAWVNKAKADRTWLVIVYHKVDTANLEPYDTYKADFDAQMAWLAQSGISVQRLDTALAEARAQR